MLLISYFLILFNFYFLMRFFNFLFRSNDIQPYISKRIPSVNNSHWHISFKSLFSRYICIDQTCNDN